MHLEQMQTVATETSIDLFKIKHTLKVFARLSPEYEALYRMKPTASV